MISVPLWEPDQPSEEPIMPKTKTAVACIREFFERDDEFAPGGGRPVPFAEVKALDASERRDLAELCATALGVTITTSAV